MKFATPVTPSSVYMSRTPFSKMPQWVSDPKGNENIICTVMMYGEMFYGRHTARTPAAV